MYKLIRNKKDLKDIRMDIDYDKPIFCDTETCAHEGYSDGGLYGQIRLIQIYQEVWEAAILIDIFFVDIYSVLALLVPGHLIWHNASYDMHTINCYTKELCLPRELGDTLYLCRLAVPIHRKYDFYSCLKHVGIFNETLGNVSKKDNQQ